MQPLDRARKMALRCKKKLEEQEIPGPFFGGGQVVVTDGYSAALLPPTDEVKAWLAANSWDCPTLEEKYSRMMFHFTPRKSYDTVVFKTTVADIWEWAVLNSEVCPKCQGTKLCVPGQEPGKGSPNEEDAFAVHYGWVGSVPVDRRRLQEILSITNLPGEQAVTLSAFLRPQTATKDFFGGVRLDSAGLIAGLIAGLNDIREGESRFQVDGKFSDIKLRHAK